MSKKRALELVDQAREKILRVGTKKADLGGLLDELRREIGAIQPDHCDTCGGTGECPDCNGTGEAN